MAPSKEKATESVKEASLASGIFDKIGKATFLIIVLTSLDKILALAKEILLAYGFGISSDLDVFNIAFAFPGVITLLLNGAFVAAFVPLFLDWHAKMDATRAKAAIATITWISIAIIFLITLLCYAFSSLLFPLLGYGFSTQEQHLAVVLGQMLVWLIFIEGVGTLISGWLHAEKRFMSLHAAPMCINLAILAFLVWGRHLGIHALVWGTLVGTLLKTLFLCVSLSREARCLFSSFSWDWTALKDFSRQFLPLICGGMLVNANIVIDQVMSTELFPGSVSALRYAFRVNDLTLQVLVIALSKAILPYVSELYRDHDIVQLKNVFNASMHIIFLAAFPITCILILHSQDIVAILFQRGAFDLSASKITAGVLTYYSIGLLFSSYCIINGTFFSALKLNTSLMWMALLAMVMNILFNLLFIRLFQDPSGIALSTTLTNGLLSIVFIVILQKKIRIIEALRDYSGILHLAGISLCTYIIMYYFRSLLMETGIPLLPAFLICAVLFLAIYAFMVFFLGNKNFFNALAMLFPPLKKVLSVRRPHF